MVYSVHFSLNPRRPPARGHKENDLMYHRRGLIRCASAVVITTAVILAGCSSGTDSAPPTTSSPADSVEGTDLPPGAEQLAGRWAHFDVVAYQDNAMKTLIISTGFSDLEVRDGQLWNQMTFCHADAGSDQDIEISISDAATRAILPVATPVEVTEVDGKLRLSRPATPTPIGIEMDDPANEALPTDPSDPRIFDADGDGNPGVTSRVKVSDELQGEIYLARREIFIYDLTQQSADRLEGSITDQSEQLVLGASNPVFATTTNWKQIDDPARNPLIWLRVDADWDCDRLAQERDRIFPPNPEADW
jgi:hypothetical protein